MVGVFVCVCMVGGLLRFVWLMGWLLRTVGIAIDCLFVNSVVIVLFDYLYVDCFFGVRLLLFTVFVFAVFGVTRVVWILLWWWFWWLLAFSMIYW